MLVIKRGTEPASKTAPSGTDQQTHPNSVLPEVGCRLRGMSHGISLGNFCSLQGVQFRRLDDEVT